MEAWSVGSVDQLEWDIKYLNPHNSRSPSSDILSSAGDLPIGIEVNRRKNILHRNPMRKGKPNFPFSKVPIAYESRSDRTSPFGKRFPQTSLKLVQRGKTYS